MNIILTAVSERKINKKAADAKIKCSGYVIKLKTLLNALYFWRFFHRFSAIFSVKTLSVFYVFSAESFCRVKMHFLNVKKSPTVFEVHTKGCVQLLGYSSLKQAGQLI